MCNARGRPSPEAGPRDRVTSKVRVHAQNLHVDRRGLVTLKTGPTPAMEKGHPPLRILDWIAAPLSRPHAGVTEGNPPGRERAGGRGALLVLGVVGKLRALANPGRRSPHSFPKDVYHRPGRGAVGQLTLHVNTPWPGR
jgi:hypothetical protein